MSLKEHKKKLHRALALLLVCVSALLPSMERNLLVSQASAVDAVADVALAPGGTIQYSGNGKVIHGGGDVLADTGSTLTGSSSNPGVRPWNDAGDNSNYMKVEMYEWHRFYDNATGPADQNEHPMMLFWTEGGKVWLASTRTGSNKKNRNGWWGDEWDRHNVYLFDPFGSNAEKEANMLVYTTKNYTDWTVQYTGEKDKENDSAKKYYLKIGNSWIRGHDWIKFDSSRTDSDHWYRWTFMAKSYDSDYADEINWDYDVMIFNEESGGYDTGFDNDSNTNDDMLFGNNDDTYNYEDCAVYYGYKKSFTAIKENLVVHDGQVVNIDDGLILTDGNTISIEPGGVLSIEGQFFNNGTIENSGTIILQPNACICSLQPQNSESGKIKCDGTGQDAATAFKKIVDNLQNRYNGLDAEHTTARQNEQTEKENVEKAQEEFDEYMKTQEGQDAELTIYEQEQEGSEMKVKQKAVSDAKDAYEALQNDPKATKENLAKAQQKMLDAQTAYETFMQEYDRITATYFELSANINNHQTSQESYKKQAEELEARMAALLPDLNNAKRNLEAAKQDTEHAWTVQGEGNLIIMKNARLFLNDNLGCKLELYGGASVVCSGYIYSMHEIICNDSKIVIKKGGGISLGYVPRTGLLSLRGTTIGADLSIVGANTVNCGSHCSQQIKGNNIVVENDGVIRFFTGAGSKPIHSNGSVINPQYGSGTCVAG